MSKIQLRRDTITRWGTFNPVLAAGEIGIDTTSQRFKVGNGLDSWSELEWGTVFVSEKGQPNGVPPLNDSAKIPPEFIDFPPQTNDTHYIAVEDYAHLPIPGEANMLYIAVDTRHMWRWDGTQYVIVASPNDAGVDQKGLLKLTGDLGGSADLPLVKKINGVVMPLTTPEPGQVLKAVTSSTTTWSNDLTGGGGGGGGDEDPRFMVFEQDNIGDGTANAFTVTHMMGTRQIVASMTRLRGDCEIINIFNMKAPSPNFVIIQPDRILDPSTWRLTLIGSMGLSDVTAPDPPEVEYVSDAVDKITASASGGVDVTGYNWFIKLTGSMDDPAFAGSTPDGDTFEFTGLLGSTEYDITATALDKAGNESTMSDPITHETPVPVPFSYTSFATIPVGTLDVPITAGAGPVTVAGTARLRETAGTAGNKNYYSIAVLPDDMHSEEFWVEAVNGGLDGATNRGGGCGLSSIDGTRAVFVVAVGPGEGVSGRIYSWKDGVVTTQASSAGITWSGGQSLRLVPTISAGGIVTWTVWKNGVATTFKWIDSGGYIGLPGTRACLAFLMIRNASTNYYGPGIASMTATPI